jgi:hypothetical protein
MGCVSASLQEASFQEKVKKMTESRFFIVVLAKEFLTDQSR